jgi:16S rRNA pseudouridine516 synthase
MRIDRFLSNLKYGTRKEIQKAVKYKRVYVNEELVKNVAFKIDPLVDKVIFDDEEVYYKETILLMMNKPPGYVSATKDGKEKTVLELINEPYSRFNLSIAGRLDKDTEGLLLLTNNGKLLHNIISPNKDVYKKYFVRVENPIKNPKKLEGSYEILDGRDYPFIPASPIVEKINDLEFYLSIKEGKFHQVKRMVEHFSNKVVYLKRVQIGQIKLDETLRLGGYKEIIDYKI